MPQFLYTTTGGTGLNSEFLFSLGQRAAFGKKGDPTVCKFPPNAGKSQMAGQLPASRSVFVSATNTVDTSYIYPLISLIDLPAYDVDMNNNLTLEPGNPNTSTVTDLFDNTSLIHWTNVNPAGGTIGASSGLVDFFGSNLPAIAFSGFRGYYLQDIFGNSSSQPFGPGYVAGAYSGLLNWDLFAIVNLPDVSKNMNLFLGVAGIGNLSPHNQFAALGFSGNRPVIASRAAGAAPLQINFATGLTLSPNTAYLVHYYSTGSAFGVKVNNLALTISPSGTSVNDGRFFNIPSVSGGTTNVGAIALGGIGFDATSSPWDFYGRLGAVKLYAGLTSAAQTSVANSIMTRFGITPLA